MVFCGRLRSPAIFGRTRGSKLDGKMPRRHFPGRVKLIRLFPSRELSCRYTCTVFGKLILGEIVNIVATRCHILKPKCTKFDFGWGSYSTPSDPLAGFKMAYFYATPALPRTGKTHNRRTSRTELKTVFCCWIYFHLSSKIFFWSSYGSDRPAPLVWICHCINYVLIM